MRSLRSRLTALLSLVLLLGLAVPAEAQRGGSRGGPSKAKTQKPRKVGSSVFKGGGSKSGKLFGGAKLKLSTPGNQSAVDIAETMEKVKSLQAQAKADLQNRDKLTIELANEAELRSWFDTADHNGNGWVSFSESAYSLRFTRGRFRAYDSDRDGRLRADEFQDYYMHSITQEGSFVKPRKMRDESTMALRTPEQLRASYDSDLNGGLSEIEVSRMMIDYDQRELDATQLMSSLDLDGNDILEVSELEGLLPILYPDDPAIAEMRPTAETYDSLLDMFGKVEPRPSDSGAPPAPPYIGGPVTLFQRLDLGRDGTISVNDLEILQRPLRIGIRPHAVINTLDLDGDLELSEEELLRALGAN